jgi:hypothetical protein
VVVFSQQSSSEYVAHTDRDRCIRHICRCPSCASPARRNPVYFHLLFFVSDHYRPAWVTTPDFYLPGVQPVCFRFMVAARGYGIADALLLTAVAIPVWHRLKGWPSLYTSCVLASLALGLSFSASFAYAFVDGAAFLTILIWAIWQREGGSALRIMVCCALQGLLLALLLCAYPAAHFTDLSWGAHSLKETRQSLLQSSLYQLDPRFREYLWFKFMTFLRSRLPPALAILCLCQLAATILDGSWTQDPRSRCRARFAAALAGIAALSVLLHWLAFHVHNLLLPLGRTGLFLVPLCSLPGPSRQLPPGLPPLVGSPVGSTPY